MSEEHSVSMPAVVLVLPPTLWQRRASFLHVFPCRILIISDYVLFSVNFLFSGAGGGWGSGLAVPPYTHASEGHYVRQSPYSGLCDLPSERKMDSFFVFVILHSLLPYLTLASTLPLTYIIEL